MRLTPLQRPAQRGVGVDRLRRAGFGFRPAAQERPLRRLPGPEGYRMPYGAAWVVDSFVCCLGKLLRAMDVMNITDHHARDAKNHVKRRGDRDRVVIEADRPQKRA